MERNPYPAPPDWAADITTVGVTGTNGKTSTTRFIWAGLGAGHPGPVGRVTTVDAAVGNEVHEPPADHDVFLGLMATLRERGGRRAALEVTSATLGLGFARAWPFRVGVFTNLGHDHLKTHGSLEHVLASKAQLFVALPPGGTAVLNAGDPNAALIAEVLGPEVRVLWFAGPGRAHDRVVDLRVSSATPREDGLELQLEADPSLDLAPRSTLTLRTPALFQADNAVAALLACLALGVPGPAAARAIADCDPPRGRFELLEGPPGRPRVIVDYAHTPEAVRAVLTSARSVCAGQVTIVLGAGGDTDRRKRAPLAAAAAAADRVWLTTDNPRHEDPRQISADLRSGLGDTPAQVELDRARAISAAIAEAGPSDLVLVLGKGHEGVQEVAGRRLPMNDVELARAALGGE